MLRSVVAPRLLCGRLQRRLMGFALDVMWTNIMSLTPVSYTHLGIHYESLKRYGPTTHYLSLKHRLSYEEIKRRMDEAGFTEGQVATIGTTETCLYADHMDLLGCYLEVHKRPENFAQPQV